MKDEQVHIGDSLLKLTKYWDFRTITWYLNTWFFQYSRGTYGTTWHNRYVLRPLECYWASRLDHGQWHLFFSHSLPVKYKYWTLLRPWVCILHSTTRQMMFKTNFSFPRVANMFTAVLNLKRPQEKERKKFFKAYFTKDNDFLTKFLKGKVFFTIYVCLHKKMLYKCINKHVGNINITLYSLLCDRLYFTW